MRPMHNRDVYRKMWRERVWDVATRYDWRFSIPTYWGRLRMIMTYNDVFNYTQGGKWGTNRRWDDE